MHTSGNVPQSLSDYMVFVRDNAEFIDCFARSSQEQSGTIAEVTTAIRWMDE